MIIACPKCHQANRVPASRLGEAARCATCKEPILPVTKPVHVGSPEEFQELTSSSSVPVLVDFWAPWCGPCRTVAPELDKIAEQKAGRVLVAKVNTDAVPQLASKFQITGIPTLVLMRGGREAQRVSGAMRAPAILSTFAL